MKSVDTSWDIQDISKGYKEQKIWKPIPSNLIEHIILSKKRFIQEDISSLHLQPHQKIHLIDEITTEVNFGHLGLISPIKSQVSIPDYASMVDSLVKKRQVPLDKDPLYTHVVRLRTEAELQHILSSKEENVEKESEKVEIKEVEDSKAASEPEAKKAKTDTEQGKIGEQG